jgi:membrane-associated phospholipid phosphatase
VNELGAAVDHVVDRALEPLRRSRVTARVFTLASHVGDFSVVWHVAGLLYAVGSVDRLKQALALSLALGIESLVVNQGVKRLFKRDRPTWHGDDRTRVRKPRTSSFPSGHASSATFAAILLASFTGWPLAALWVVIAVVVASSRVVVRIHHFTDVIGGFVVGGLLGFLALPIIALV